MTWYTGLLELIAAEAGMGLRDFKANQNQSNADIQVVPGNSGPPDTT